MAQAYNKFRQFVEDLAKKVHNVDSDTFKLALCAAANAPVNTNSVLADLTTVAYTNISGGQPTLTKTSVEQTAGVLNAIFEDEVILASGGTVATFRYVAIYNDTAAGDPLVCWYDLGTDIVLLDGQQLTLDFDGTNGIFSIT